MNKLIVPLILMICLWLVPDVARAGVTPPEEAGMTAAKEWLAIVDAGKYPESWGTMAAGFKKEVSKRKWKNAITEIRQPLGKLVSRKFKSAEYSKELPGAPEGEYVIVQFDAAFEKKQAATEKVTLILGQDLFWRVSGYAVK